MTIVLAGTVGAATSTQTWHRINVHSDPPEHERFGCLVAGEAWRCRYDKLPEPTLGFAWDQTRGSFSGTDTTSDWTCPGWFPSEACEAADLVISGEAVFYQPKASGSFTNEQQLLVGDDGSLWIYWIQPIGEFVCPWYPTFADALANESESFCTFA